MVGQKVMVVAAHLGDFIWSSGGVIARYAALGNEIYVVVLSYGSKGEAEDYWVDEGRTLKGCDEERRREGESAARILGVSSIEFCGYEDSLLTMDKGRIDKLASAIRRFRPDFILTHDRRDDIFNPDHNLARQSVMAAYQTASGGGYIDGYPVAPRQTPIFGFEPYNAERCHFIPEIYVDISEVMDKKTAAMQLCRSQSEMCRSYIKKAEMRAEELSEYRNRTCAYAEAFSRFGPIAKYGYFVW